MILAAHAAIALGTLTGGWRIVHTMGSKITKLQPIGGFAAETAGAITLFTASSFGIPGQHDRTPSRAPSSASAPSGACPPCAGAARQIVWAWVLTIPAAGAIAALTYRTLTLFCRALRGDKATDAIPIIMVTARAEETDRIVGLELGADDYLAKPFSPNELVARVRALMRRAHRNEPQGSTLRLGPIAMDLERHTVLDEGREVKLTAKEFMLLQYLLEHRGRVLSRDLLLGDVWGYRYTGGTRTVDVHVRRLREKLPALVDALVTVKQFGYKLVDEEAT